MKRDRDGTEIEEPEGFTDADRAKVRLTTGADLPVLVTGPGWYVSRDGRRVKIERVRTGVSAPTFNCAGYLYAKEGTRKAPEWNIWRANGRWGGLGEHAKDIVRKA